MDILQNENTKDTVIRVINDRVLIRPLESENVQGVSKEVSEAIRSNTIVLPEEYEGLIKKTPEWGHIVAWGDRCKYSWKYNTKVHFARLSSAKVRIMGEDYCLVREYDIDCYEESK